MEESVWAFGLDTGSPTFGVLVKVIEEQKKQDVSTEFLLNFIAAAINCCVMSTDNTSVNFKFLCSCKDITKVSKLDWCLFTKQSMTEAVRKWKKGSSYFTGPLPFMMIVYFDRLQRGDAYPPRQIPLTSVWNKDMIHSRMKIELERGYGRGHVLPRIPMPEIEKCLRLEENPRIPVPEIEKCLRLEENPTASLETRDYFAQFSTMAATLVKKFSVMYAFISMFEDVQIQKELKTIIVDKMYKYTDPAHVFDESAFMAELNEALSNIQAKNNQNEVTHSDTTASTLHAFFTGENQASQLQNQASALTVHTSTVLTPTTVQKTQSPTTPPPQKTPPPPPLPPQTHTEDSPEENPPQTHTEDSPEENQTKKNEKKERM
ncbi:uncharacterized protein LOC110736998 isoform X1 [Chenopodium quinoa]|uniref:uncharacterized protein LOC110736998 isoform X1 n=1 Tax=Chenopodium quinoa TaxID=63459 RepID=UPI000B770581|nr:uncharacterized protein LOC110736998 isoform X1 [Chenopodium quinoa]